MSTCRLAGIVCFALLMAPAYAAQPDHPSGPRGGESQHRDSGAGATARPLLPGAHGAGEVSCPEEGRHRAWDYVAGLRRQRGLPSLPPPPGQRRILFYRAPMGADTSPVPKKDQMGMDYVPVYEGKRRSDGTVTVSPDRVQVLGVRTEAARRQTLASPIRAVGTIAADERRVAVVAPRFEGWVQDLLVNTTGQAVKRGETLFTFYSPEAAAAEREYIVARQFSGAVAEAATAKLRNLGIPRTASRSSTRGGKASNVLSYPAPLDGIVMDKAVLAGQRFAAGDTLYRIADLSTVWVLADVFEQDLAAVRAGEAVAIRLTAYPGQTSKEQWRSSIPTLNPTTRTAKVRIELANPDGLLKPDMYATVMIAAGGSGQDVLTVPESALLDDGTRQIVLVERSPGRYQPRVVTIGRARQRRRGDHQWHRRRGQGGGGGQLPDRCGKQPAQRATQFHST